MTAEIPAPQGQRPSLRGLVAYLTIAYGMAWVVSVPLWLIGSLEKAGLPMVTLIGVVMMYTPTLAAVVACKIDRLPFRRTVGLGLGPRPGRTVLTGALVVGLVFLVALAALGTSALFGTYDFDLVAFDGARRLLESTLRGQPLPLPLPLMVVILIVQAFTLGTLISSAAALGEEIGWRGYLTPLLVDRLGAPLATLSVGVIWGAWHAPLLLLGYNYPTLPGWQSIVWMSMLCTILSAVLGWGSLRTGSVIPAALGHGALNAGAGTLAIMLSAVPSFDAANSTIMGWAGWPGALLIAGALLAFAWPKRAPEPSAASTWAPKWTTAPGRDSSPARREQP